MTRLEEYGLFIGTILMNQGDARKRVEIIDGRRSVFDDCILFSSTRDALEKIGGGGAYRAVQAIQERYIETRRVLIGKGGQDLGIKER